MKALTENDLIVGLQTGTGVGGYPVPTALRNLHFSRLRVDGGAVVDVATYNNFWVDDQGRKHITQSEPSWQALTCAWDDELILDSGTWRTKTPTELLTDEMDAAYERVRGALYYYITQTSDFPEWKQANYNQRYSELIVGEIGNGLTPEEQQELTDLRSVIAWKNTLLTERDRVKTDIYAATDSAGIATAEASLTLTPPPMNL